MAGIGMYGVFYAKCKKEEGVVTGYEGGVKTMGKAISANFEPKTPEDNPLYANNGVAENDASGASGGNLTMTLDRLGQEAAADLFGLKVEDVTITDEKAASGLTEEEKKGKALKYTVELQGITSQVTGLEGRMTTSEQTAEGFRRDITGLDGRFNTIEETVNAVTYTGPDGRVMISNGSIDLTGAITWNDLDATAQGQVTAAQSAASSAQSTANSAASAASAAQGVIDSWGYQYGGTTYIDGNKLMTGTVRASSLEGGMVSLLTAAAATAGMIFVTGSSSFDYSVEVRSYGALRLVAAAGDVFIQGGGNAYVQLTGGNVVIGTNGNLIPRSSTSCVGSASAKWSAIYASTGEIQTSDANLKHDIEAVPDVYYRVLARIDLKRFKLNDGTSDRYHVGFIAQDVETAMEAEGLDSKDFGGFVADVDDAGNPVYMLRYTEFMPLILGYARQLEKRIAVLEEQQNG